MNLRSFYKTNIYSDLVCSILPFLSKKQSFLEKGKLFEPNWKALDRDEQEEMKKRSSFFQSLRIDGDKFSVINGAN